METYTLWVCDNCMLHHANGECGDCHGDEGHDAEPWSKVDPDDHYTMGLLREEHSPLCENITESEDVYDCSCDVWGFSWSSCDGCGSTLGGNRNGFTGWILD